MTLTRPDASQMADLALSVGIKEKVLRVCYKSPRNHEKRNVTQKETLDLKDSDSWIWKRSSHLALHFPKEEMGALRCCDLPTRAQMTHLGT